MLHGVSGNICCFVSLEPNYVNKAAAGELCCFPPLFLSMVSLQSPARSFYICHWGDLRVTFYISPEASDRRES